MSVVEALLEDILVDAYGEHEQLWAFCAAIEDGVPMPSVAELLGVTLEVVAVDFDGDSRRGLRALCRWGQKTKKVDFADLEFPQGSDAERYQAAYRQWLGPT